MCCIGSSNAVGSVSCVCECCSFLSTLCFTHDRAPRVPLSVIASRIYPVSSFLCLQTKLTRLPSVTAAKGQKGDRKSQIPDEKQRPGNRKHPRASSLNFLVRTLNAWIDRNMTDCLRPPYSHASSPREGTNKAITQMLKQWTTPSCTPTQITLRQQRLQQEAYLQEDPLNEQHKRQPLNEKVQRRVGDKHITAAFNQCLSPTLCNSNSSTNNTLH